MSQQSSLFNPYIPAVFINQKARSLTAELLELYKCSSPIRAVLRILANLIESNMHKAAVDTINCLYDQLGQHTSPGTADLFGGTYGWVLVELFIVAMSEELERFDTEVECLYHCNAKALMCVLYQNGDELDTIVRKMIGMMEEYIRGGKCECAVLTLRDLYLFTGIPFPSEFNEIPSRECFDCILEALKNALLDKSESQFTQKVSDVMSDYYAMVWADFKRHNAQRGKRRVPGMMGCFLGPVAHVIPMDEFRRNYVIY